MADRTPTGGIIDLTACDREPIHIPAAVQPRGHIIIEFEALAPHRAFSADPLAAVRTMVDRMSREISVADLCRVATEEVRRTTGYDRVMVYRFLPDDSGCVVAESTVFGLEPFLGLHYPASDIPA